MSADFVVTGPHGAPRAFFEVKRRSQTSASWARQLRNHLVHQPAGGDADYFAIVTLDALYLWSPGAETDSEPVVVPIGDVLREYASRLRQDLSTLSSQGFELLVSAWLEDLVDGLSGTAVPAELRDAVRGGRLALESELNA